MNKIYTAVAPSNIAWIKYWGKRPGANQWPTNDSISMTLSKIATTTLAKLTSTSEYDRLTWDGNTLSDCDPRYRRFAKFLDFLKRETGFRGALQIETSNSFPTGAGIASSASGFAALTVASLAAMHKIELWDELITNFGLQRLAHFARIGSGSACRSLLGGIVHWHSGSSAEDQLITQLVPAEDWALSDVVMVVEGAQKHTGSSDGHQAAWTSPIFGLRLSGLAERLERLKSAIAKRDFPEVGVILEQEAIEMHSVMMTSMPPIFYAHTRTWEILSWLRRWRSESGIEVFFTLDAGPNPHLICRQRDQKVLVDAIHMQYPDIHTIIDDIGTGIKLSGSTTFAREYGRTELASNPN
jgi:diphosphomevalonate decarboxylase